MNPDLVLGVDCSTTGCKAIAWDSCGKRVAEGRSNLSFSTPKPLWHEQSAAEWWYATVTALKSVCVQIDPDRLASICIAHQRETFVPVDESGIPLRPAILWMDERAGDQLAVLEKAIGKERFHILTGKPLSGNLSVAKLAWLRAYEPNVFNRIGKVLDVHAFLAHHLTGHYRTGWGCVGPMGLFDMQQDRWAEEILEYLDLQVGQFPEAFPAGVVIGEVRDEAARETGLPVGLPVVAGIGDGQAAGLGTGVTKSGASYLSLGTSVVSGTFAPVYRVSDNFRTMYGGMPDSYLLETVILGGAYTISWFLEKIVQPYQRGGECRNYEMILEKEAEAVPPGAQGLMIVPYWNSAMNPYWDANASGMIVGLRGVHGRGHIYRAILEGIGFEQNLHTRGVENELGKSVDEFVVVGGGSRSALWCQIIADITGKPVNRARESEATALGAGILAASAVGLHLSAHEAAEVMVNVDVEVFEPDQRTHFFYADLFENVYRHLYPALRFIGSR